MKLEVAVLWETKDWDTYQIDVPFELDRSSKCWQRCEAYCKYEAHSIPDFRKAIRIVAWDIVE